MMMMMAHCVNFLIVYVQSDNIERKIVYARLRCRKLFSFVHDGVPCRCASR